MSWWIIPSLSNSIKQQSETHQDIFQCHWFDTPTDKIRQWNEEKVVNALPFFEGGEDQKWGLGGYTMENLKRFWPIWLLPACTWIHYLILISFSCFSLLCFLRIKRAPASTIYAKFRMPSPKAPSHVKNDIKLNKKSWQARFLYK